MFLYEGDCLKNITEIRGIRYVTVSHYSGDTVIQNKMAELIKRDFHPSELNNLTNESSVVWIWLFRRKVGIVCPRQTKRRTSDGTGKRCSLLPVESR